VVHGQKKEAPLRIYYGSPVVFAPSPITLVPRDADDNHHGEVSEILKGIESMTTDRATFVSGVIMSAGRAAWLPFTPPSGG
jgi:hypothetical protein